MKKVLLLVVILALAAPFVNAQGCMEPSSDEGASIMGYIQPEWKYGFYENQDENGNTIASDSNSFYFRRARLGVAGNIPYDFSYYVLAEFSSFMGGPYLLDAFITYKGLGPYANISLGQFKKPFGLEVNTPCHALHTIQRSEVVNVLAAPMRELGVLVSGGTDTLSIFGMDHKNVFTWSLGMFNGTGMNAFDNNAQKDFVGRLTFSPFEFIRFGGSYMTGKQANPTSDTLTDTRSRWGVDLEVNYKNFLLQGEYIGGNDEGSIIQGGGGCGGAPTVVPGSAKSNGYFVQAMYMTPWYLQPIVKYEVFDPNTSEEEAYLYNKRSTLTFGLNYFFNDWTRLQVNYLYNVEESSDSNPDQYNEYPNDMFIVQLQVKIN